MTIRNIITTSALVVLLGLSGGSAFAMEYLGTVDDGHNTTSAVDAVSIEAADNFEGSNVPGHILRELEIN